MFGHSYFGNSYFGGSYFGPRFIVTFTGLIDLVMFTLHFRQIEDFDLD